jgi:hypothetical protein
MLKATLLDIPKEERQNKDTKQQPQKRMNNTKKKPTTPQQQPSHPQYAYAGR